MKKEVILMNEQNNLGQNQQQSAGYPPQYQPDMNNNQGVNSVNNYQQNQVEQINQVNELQQQVQPTNQGQQTIQQAPQQPVQQQPQQPMSQPINQVQQPIQQPQQVNVSPGQVDSPINQQLVNQDIVAQAPLNPLANNQQTTATNGVYGPSVPLNTAADATNIGFVASSAPLKKKSNKGLIIGIVLIVLIGLGLLGYFVIYPYIVKTYFSDPKNVYESTINAVFKKINTTANTLVHQKAIYNLEASFDSNIETLKPYTGYTYGINLGVDPTNKTFQSGIIIKNSEESTEHSYYEYLKDNKEYAKYSSYRGYIYLGEADLQQQTELFSSFEDMFNNSEKLNSEEIEYLSNKLAELLISSIDENKLSKEDAIIKVNNEELKVTNNKYTIDKDVLSNTKQVIVDGLKNDDKALDILARMSDSEKDQVTEYLDTLMGQEIEISEDGEEQITYFNIYSYGLKNEIVGFELTNNRSDSRLYYYFNNKEFELGSYIYSNDIETGKETENVLIATGVKNGSTTKVTIKINDEEFGTLDVKKWNDTGIELDYSLIINSDEVNGTLKLESDVNEERAKYNFEISVNKGEEFISISFSFDEDWTSEVANINTNNADTLTDEELAQKKQEFTNALMETPIGILFSTVSNDYDQNIYNYYDNSNNTNNVNSETTNTTVNNVPIS